MADILPSYSPLPALIYKYPDNLSQPPVDKWIHFEVKSGRYVIRETVLTEQNSPDRTIASVGLYLTESALKSSMMVSYEKNNLGPFAGAALEYFGQTAKNNMDSVPNNTSDMFGGISSFLKKIYNGELNNSFKAAIEADIQRGLDAVTNDAVTRLRGAKVNPRTDILFNSQEYRQHQLSFLLVPRTLAEAKSIDAILRIFQFYMLPAYQHADKQLGFLLGFPYEFTITMKDGAGKTLEHINKIGRSVLINCDIDHTAGSDTAFVKDNGVYYPVATTLTLTFQEVRLLARDSEEITRANTPVLEDPRTH